MSKPAPCRLFMWAGGKTKMLPHYKALLPDNVHERPYVEPFAGGAALFNHLSEDVSLSGILSDLNEEIIDLYRLIRDDPEFLIESMTRRNDAGCHSPLRSANRSITNFASSIGKCRKGRRQQLYSTSLCAPASMVSGKPARPRRGAMERRLDLPHKRSTPSIPRQCKPGQGSLLAWICAPAL